MSKKLGTSQTAIEVLTGFVGKEGLISDENYFMGADDPCESFMVVNDLILNSY